MFLVIYVKKVSGAYG